MFIINFKVMYSTLYNILPVYFPEIKLLYKNQATKVNFRQHRKFTFVRNPFHRAVSAFFGKCHKAPQDDLLRESVQLQVCQEQILRALQEVRGQTFAIVKPATPYCLDNSPEERECLNANLRLLTTIGFEEYVHCLERILQLEYPDGHFERQYNAFLFPGQPALYNRFKIWNKTNIFKLENVDRDWARVCKRLGKNMDLVKDNATAHLRPDYKSFYTRHTQQKILKLYKTDFEEFRYSKHL